MSVSPPIMPAPVTVVDVVPVVEIDAAAVKSSIIVCACAMDRNANNHPQTAVPTHNGNLLCILIVYLIKNRGRTVAAAHLLIFTLLHIP